MFKVVPQASSGAPVLVKFEVSPVAVVPQSTARAVSQVSPGGTINSQATFKSYTPAFAPNPVT